MTAHPTNRQIPPQIVISAVLDIVPIGINSIDRTFFIVPPLPIGQRHYKLIDIVDFTGEINKSNNSIILPGKKIDNQTRRRINAVAAQWKKFIGSAENSNGPMVFHQFQKRITISKSLKNSIKTHNKMISKILSLPLRGFHALTKFTIARLAPPQITGGKKRWAFPGLTLTPSQMEEPVLTVKRKGHRNRRNPYFFGNQASNTLFRKRFGTSPSVPRLYTRNGAINPDLSLLVSLMVNKALKAQQTLAASKSLAPAAPLAPVEPSPSPLAKKPKKEEEISKQEPQSPPSSPPSGGPLEPPIISSTPISLSASMPPVTSRPPPSIPRHEDRPNFRLFGRETVRVPRGNLYRPVSTNMSDMSSLLFTPPATLEEEDESLANLRSNCEINRLNTQRLQTLTKQISRLSENSNELSRAADIERLRQELFDLKNSYQTNYSSLHSSSQKETRSTEIQNRNMADLRSQLSALQESINTLRAPERPLMEEIARDWSNFTSRIAQIQTQGAVERNDLNEINRLVMLNSSSLATVNDQIELMHRNKTQLFREQRTRLKEDIRENAQVFENEIERIRNYMREISSGMDHSDLASNTFLMQQLTVMRESALTLATQITNWDAHTTDISGTLARDTDGLKQSPLGVLTMAIDATNKKLAEDPNMLASYVKEELNVFGHVFDKEFPILISEQTIKMHKQLDDQSRTISEALKNREAIALNENNAMYANAILSMDALTNEQRQLQENQRNLVSNQRAMSANKERGSRAQQRQQNQLRELKQDIIAAQDHLAMYANLMPPKEILSDQVIQTILATANGRVSEASRAEMKYLYQHVSGLIAKYNDLKERAFIQTTTLTPPGQENSISMTRLQLASASHDEAADMITRVADIPSHMLHPAAAALLQEELETNQIISENRLLLNEVARTAGKRGSSTAKNAISSILRTNLALTRQFEEEMSTTRLINYQQGIQNRLQSQQQQNEAAANPPKSPAPPEQRMKRLMESQPINETEQGLRPAKTLKLAPDLVENLKPMAEPPFQPPPKALPYEHRPEETPLPPSDDEDDLPEETSDTAMGGGEPAVLREQTSTQNPLHEETAEPMDVEKHPERLIHFDRLKPTHGPPGNLGGAIIVEDKHTPRFCVRRGNKIVCYPMPETEEGHLTEHDAVKMPLQNEDNPEPSLKPLNFRNKKRPEKKERKKKEQEEKRKQIEGNFDTEEEKRKFPLTEAQKEQLAKQINRKVHLSDFEHLRAANTKPDEPTTEPLWKEDGWQYREQVDGERLSKSTSNIGDLPTFKANRATARMYYNNLNNLYSNITKGCKGDPCYIDLFKPLNANDPREAQVFTRDFLVKIYDTANRIEKGEKPRGTALSARESLAIAEEMKSTLHSNRVNRALYLASNFGNTHNYKDFVDAIVQYNKNWNADRNLMPYTPVADNLWAKTLLTYTKENEETKPTRKTTLFTKEELQKFTETLNEIYDQPEGNAPSTADMDRWNIQLAKIKAKKASINEKNTTIADRSLIARLETAINNEQDQYNGMGKHPRLFSADEIVQMKKLDADLTTMIKTKVSNTTIKQREYWQAKLTKRMEVPRKGEIDNETENLVNAILDKIKILGGFKEEKPNTTSPPLFNAEELTKLKELQTSLADQVAKKKATTPLAERELWKKKIITRLEEPRKGRIITDEENSLTKSILSDIDTLNSIKEPPPEPVSLFTKEELTQMAKLDPELRQMIAEQIKLSPREERTNWEVKIAHRLEEPRNGRVISNIDYKRALRILDSLNSLSKMEKENPHKFHESFTDKEIRQLDYWVGNHQNLEGAHADSTAKLLNTKRIIELKKKTSTPNTITPEQKTKLDEISAKIQNALNKRPDYLKESKEPIGNRKFLMNEAERRSFYHLLDRLNKWEDSEPNVNMPRISQATIDRLTILANTGNSTNMAHGDQELVKALRTSIATADEINARKNQKAQPLFSKQALELYHDLNTNFGNQYTDLDQTDRRNYYEALSRAIPRATPTNIDPDKLTMLKNLRKKLKTDIDRFARRENSLVPLTESEKLWQYLIQMENWYEGKGSKPILDPKGRVALRDQLVAQLKKFTTENVEPTDRVMIETLVNLLNHSINEDRYFELREPVVNKKESANIFKIIKEINDFYENKRLTIPLYSAKRLELLNDLLAKQKKMTDLNTLPEDRAAVNLLVTKLQQLVAKNKVSSKLLIHVAEGKKLTKLLKEINQWTASKGKQPMPLTLTGRKQWLADLEELRSRATVGQNISQGNLSVIDGLIVNLKLMVKRDNENIERQLERASSAKNQLMKPSEVASFYRLLDGYIKWQAGKGPLPENPEQRYHDYLKVEDLIKEMNDHNVVASADRTMLRNLREVLKEVMVYDTGPGKILRDQKIKEARQLQYVEKTRELYARLTEARKKGPLSASDQAKWNALQPILGKAPPWGVLEDPPTPIDPKEHHTLARLIEDALNGISEPTTVIPDRPPPTGWSGTEVTIPPKPGEEYPEANTDHDLDLTTDYLNAEDTTAHSGNVTGIPTSTPSTATATASK